MKLQPTFHIFFLSFALLTPIAFLGFDVTDTGYHLSNQLTGIYTPYWWLSDLIGGLWLKIAYPFGLVGARLGAVFAYALCAAITYSSFSKKDLWLAASTFAALFIAAKPLFVGPVMILDYYTVPMLLGVITVSCYLKNKSPFLLGFLFAISTLSRFTMILLLLLKCNMKILLSFIITLFCFSYFLPLGEISSLSDGRDSGNNIILYLAELKSLVPIWILLGIALITDLFLKRWFFVYQFLLFTLFFSWFKLDLYVHQTLIIGVVITLIGVFSKNRWWVGVGLLFALAVGIGSDTGLAKLGYGSWFLVASLPLVVQKNKALLIVLIALNLNGFLGLYLNTYRDDLLYSSFTVMNNGVITQKKRAEVYQELIDELKKRVEPGDKILAYPYIPMVYFSTNTLPVGGTTNLCFFSTERLRELFFEMERPKLIVRANRSTRTKTWPDNALEADFIAERTRVIDENFPGRVVWSNGVFNISLPNF